MAYYLYCLTRTEDLPLALSEVEGRLFLHPHADLCALLEEVDAAEYCGEDAEARHQNPEWLLPRLRRHEHIVETLLQHAPVLPAGFATLFSGLSAVESFMTVHADTVRDFLLHVQDTAEWAVKGWLAQTEAVDALAAEQSARAELPESPGMRYVEERRIRLAAEKQVSGAVREACAEVLPALQAVSVDFVQRPLLKAGGSPDKPVCNWALLLPCGAEARLVELLEEANRRCPGLRFECSGPWPPYSFTPKLANDA